jgi:hypothetical protein
MMMIMIIIILSCKFGLTHIPCRTLHRGTTIGLNTGDDSHGSRPHSIRSGSQQVFGHRIIHVTHFIQLSLKILCMCCCVTRGF